MNSNHRTSANTAPRLANARFAGLLLGVSRWTIYHWARVGLLASVQLGRRRLFELSALEEFVAQGKRLGRLAPGTVNKRITGAAGRGPRNKRPHPGGETGLGS
jgi:excisionase family DNA binding protein